MLQPFLLPLLRIFDSKTNGVEFELSYDDDRYDNVYVHLQLSAPTSNERNLWLKKLKDAKTILIASEKQLMESSNTKFYYLKYCKNCY